MSVENATAASRLGTAALVATSGVAVAAVLATTAVWQSRLPSRIAIHWSAGGRPNGHLPLSLLTVLVAAALVLCGVAAIRARRRGHPTAATMLLVAGMLAAAHWATLRANLDASSWREAHVSTGGLLALMSAGALAGLLAGLAVDATVRKTGRPPPALGSSRLRARAPTRAVWTTEATPGALGRIGTVATLCVVAVLVVVSGQLGAASAAVLAGVALVALLFTRVRVSVGSAGVAVRFGPAGWPRIRVPLEQIRSADVVDVEPMRYGGWGYRGRGRTTAVVIRRGPGLRVTTDRRDLIVTLHDADEAAAVLNDLLARPRSGSG